jgi:hypothetical protein
MKEFLHDLMFQRPTVGVLSGAASGGFSLLSLLGIITPIMGFFATLIGLVVAILHLKLEWRRWKKVRNEEIKGNTTEEGD